MQSIHHILSEDGSYVVNIVYVSDFIFDTDPTGTRFAPEKGVFIWFKIYPYPTYIEQYNCKFIEYK